MDSPAPLVIPTQYRNPEYSDGHPYAVELAHVGQGNWRAFRTLGLDLRAVLDIARSWAPALAGIERPWLCWAVDEDWSLVQQRLVALAGWTPVVGFDPRVGPPRRCVPGAVVVDFNAALGLPILYPHFPLEFAFLFCDRLAFWHSDLLLREGTARRLAARFERLRSGETAATRSFTGWRRLFSRRDKRFWELVGCTTRAASADQFAKGCGWWMDYWAHPNQARPDFIRANRYWDHGSGLYHWVSAEGGRCRLIGERALREGHFTKIGKADYRGFREPGAQSDARRAMGGELRDNFDLGAACRTLGLEGLLP